MENEYGDQRTKYEQYEMYKNSLPPLLPEEYEAEIEAIVDFVEI